MLLWIGNDSVNYVKLYTMDRQSLLECLQESPQMFILKCIDVCVDNLQ